MTFRLHYSFLSNNFILKCQMSLQDSTRNEDWLARSNVNRLKPSIKVKQNKVNMVDWFQNHY